jgi:hypothetical protein
MLPTPKRALAMAISLLGTARAKKRTGSDGWTRMDTAEKKHPIITFTLNQRRQGWVLQNEMFVFAVCK